MRARGKIYLASGAAMLAAILLFASGCGGVAAKSYELYSYFGTQSVIALYADFSDNSAAADVSAALNEIETAFSELDSAISVSVSGSDIARFNSAGAGEAVRIAAITHALLARAQEMHAYTNGAYNPAVGLLVDLWGFSPRFSDFEYNPTMPYDREVIHTPPAEEYIEAFRTLLNFEDIELIERGGEYYAVKPTNTATVNGVAYSMQIDLGGMGKGYAADRAREVLLAHGISEAYASVGTSSLALLANNSSAQGAPESSMWAVSLAHPRGDSPYLSVFAKNETGSTSGDYEHTYTGTDGVNYCHIIDPTTGRPITSGMATASLFGRTAADGDALTTALCVMGRDRAIEFVNAKLLDCRVAMVCDGADGLELLTNMDEGSYALNADIRVSSRASGGGIEYVG